MCTLHLKEKTPVSNFVMHKEFGEEDDKFQAHSQCFLKISKGWILPFFSQPKIDPRSQAKSNCTCSTKKTGISQVKLTVISMVGVHGIRLTSTLNEEGQIFQKGNAKTKRKSMTQPLPILQILEKCGNFYELHGWFKILPWIFFTPWKIVTWKPEDCLIEKILKRKTHRNQTFVLRGPWVPSFIFSGVYSPKPQQSSRKVA